MQNRTTTSILFAACLAAAVSLGGASYGEGEQTALDVSAITKLVVTGEASMTKLTTAVGTPYTASLRSVPVGWFSHWQSSWFSNTCKPVGALRIEGNTLFLDVPSTSIFDSSDCTAELTANLPAGLAVSIEQAALQANLQGAFADVTLRSKAADVSLDGHAARIDIAGEAIRARLDFSGVGNKQGEDVRIDAKALDADLTFAADVPIRYTVNATASFVDSKRENTPGASSSVLIKGDFVRAAIR